MLEDLYNGKIIPIERYIKDQSDYQKTNKTLVKNIDNLFALLNDNQKQLCEKVFDNFTDLEYISELESFSQGFCIGAKLILEIFNYESENFVVK